MLHLQASVKVPSKVQQQVSVRSGRRRKTTKRNTGRILEADLLVISSGCFVLWRIGLIYMVRVAKKCVSAISKTFPSRMTSKR